MTTQAQLQQQRRNTIVRVRQRQNYPTIFTKSDLYAKITAACTEVGIDEITLREWKRNTYGTEMTDGVIRQTKYESPDNSHSQTLQDLAYLVDESKHPRETYNTNMVHINGNAFSDQKAKQFYQALQQQGLEPSFYQSYASSGISVSDIEIRQKKERRKQNIIYK